MISRRAVLASALAAPFALSACSQLPRRRPPTKRIAITMDDFVMRDGPLARDLAIRSALARHGIQAAGFVTTSHLDTPEGRQVVADWAADGHILGNHTHTHPWAKDTEVAAYWQDIETAHARLEDLPGFVPAFRFPFLDEGRDRARQLELHARLRRFGYAYAPVTIDAFDWAITERYEAARAAGRDRRAHRDFYVAAVVDLAEHYHRIASQLGQPDLPHLLLTHHVPVTGAYLGDALDALSAAGWTFVPAREALAHPLYAGVPPEPNRSRSLLDTLASARKAEVDPYPARFRKAGRETMDALGL